MNADVNGFSFCVYCEIENGYSGGTTDFPSPLHLTIKHGNVCYRKFGTNFGWWKT